MGMFIGDRPMKTSKDTYRASILLDPGNKPIKGLGETTASKDKGKLRMESMAKNTSDQ